MSFIRILAVLVLIIFAQASATFVNGSVKLTSGAFAKVFIFTTYIFCLFVIIHTNFLLIYRLSVLTNGFLFVSMKCTLTVRNSTNLRK